MTKIFLQSSFKSHVSYGGLVYSRMQVYNSKKNPWEFFSRGNWSHSRLHSFPLLPIPIAVGNRIPTVICNAMHALRCCVPAACDEYCTGSCSQQGTAKCDTNSCASGHTFNATAYVCGPGIYTICSQCRLYLHWGPGHPPPPNGAPR